MRFSKISDELGNIIALKFVGRRNIIGNWIGAGNHAIVFAEDVDGAVADRGIEKCVELGCQAEAGELAEKNK